MINTTNNICERCKKPPLVEDEFSCFTYQQLTDSCTCMSIAKHARWVKSRRVIKIHFSRNYIYEIDLDRMRTRLELLDWIFQLFNKSSVTPEIMYDILHEMERACRETFGDGMQTIFVWNSKIKNWKTGKLESK